LLDQERRFVDQLVGGKLAGSNRKSLPADACSKIQALRLVFQHDTGHIGSRRQNRCMELYGNEKIEGLRPLQELVVRRQRSANRRFRQSGELRNLLASI